MLRPERPWHARSHAGYTLFTRENRTAARGKRLLLRPDRVGVRENRTAARELKRLLHPNRTAARELKRLLHPDRLEARAARSPARQAESTALWQADLRRCNKTTTASRRKAAGRAGKCREPEILAAGRSPAVPLLWSRELRRSQESFVNEKPFLTRKFDPFLEQLPETSRLRDTWHGGCDTCDTCAVVGASGSLLNRVHGKLIDAHQVVFRPNWIRTRGYEQHVGTRTHVNLFFGVEGMIDQFERAQLALPREQRAVGLVTSASDRSVASFFRHSAPPYTVLQHPRLG
jgi:hypothetical protein